MTPEEYTQAKRTLEPGAVAVRHDLLYASAVQYGLERAAREGVNVFIWLRRTNVCYYVRRCDSGPPWIDGVKVERVAVVTPRGDVRISEDA